MSGTKRRAISSIPTCGARHVALAAMAAIFESHGQTGRAMEVYASMDQSDERVVTRQAEILTEAALKLQRTFRGKRRATRLSGGEKRGARDERTARRTASLTSPCSRRVPKTETTELARSVVRKDRNRSGARSFDALKKNTVATYPSPSLSLRRYGARRLTAHTCRNLSAPRIRACSASSGVSRRTSTPCTEHRQTSSYASSVAAPSAAPR